MSKKINILGQKYGLLTVIEEAPNDKSGNAMWKCKCECGKIIITKGSRLRSGGATSCGCKRTKSLIEYNHSRMKDLTNQKFNMLTALYPNGNNNNRNIIWHCKCDCGNECDVNSHDLIKGNTKSCGCKQNNSYGEQKISQILKENNILYEREKTFSTCIFPDTQRLAKFDFYLPDYNILIEYDGIQHFVIGNGQYDNPEKFKITQEHDKFKDQWCKDNNITLIRIPYTKYNNLKFEDLIPKP